jgi:hypothetical protein
MAGRRPPLSCRNIRGHGQLASYMWRVLQLRTIATNHHGPPATLTGSTSQYGALGMEHNTLAQPSLIRKTRSRVPLEHVRKKDKGNSINASNKGTMSVGTIVDVSGISRVQLSLATSPTNQEKNAKPTLRPCPARPTAPSSGKKSHKASKEKHQRGESSAAGLPSRPKLGHAPPTHSPIRPRLGPRGPDRARPPACADYRPLE